MASSKISLDVEQCSDLKRKDVKKLRLLITDVIPNFKPTDNQLFLFLHSCYYDIERAKSTAVAYYEKTKKWPEVFTNRNPTLSPMVDNLSIACMRILPGTTNEGYQVMFVKLIDNDSSKYNLELQIKIFLAIVDFHLENSGGADGLVVLFDLKELGWGHFQKFGISTVRKFIDYLQRALPVRLKGIHIINVNVIVEKIYVVAKLFMANLLDKLIYLHPNLESLYKYVPKHRLPIEYGGPTFTVKDLHEAMIKTLLDHAEFYNEDQPKRGN